MKRVVWKYELKPGETELQVPQHGVVMHWGVQHGPMDTVRDGGHVCVWMLVDPTAPKEKRRFFTVGTGNEFEMTEGHVVVGSVQMTSTLIGELVIHIFEIIDFT